ncbi:MAG: flavodoxin-dependent (E)-4-hydroxy-3-methylbut-2-enyl-diphosphate synthase [Deltaproteobacteria bacterium]|nr:flavodoxin-dependent (E)-4-hydroxy-3-methylbut-2-enyl-diphosphate synthase [Deltaproteobacteria bacterium]MBW1813044.1 flavodoxin-dependent (E)-4-hydroxy-3-methylbut-2-enyl-diphosphate synthase [Deltaproteobacteria bacterium]MBW1847991.1 flavodoxin-dependent (E)-4-hydroxy-3-methylbut-2-enyl-diphosphate synthase [Deltaproteobacteria bacterium]MBW2364730.1 flavodoxin-dependent (E)-4-hydroxy-3-methylbut-2-enyl-diphosphate synthase [Deltaproteobacteria bacterium]
MPFSIKRKKTRQIMVGGVNVGGAAAISVQSMTNTLTQDVTATVGQINQLEAAGCEIIRVAVPNEESALAISAIKKKISIPIIADVHFDYRLAISAAKSGADCLRINPGNIGGKEKIKRLIEVAKDLNISIRIGVNSGSLEKDLYKKYGGSTPKAMVESAIRHIDILKAMDFYSIKVSIKASDVLRTVEAYELLSSKTDLPLHVGVTEAGPLYPGIVKSSLGIGMLLAKGIGDTLRVSLTRDPVEEVRVGYEILSALNIRKRGPEIIACPTCGRTSINLFKTVEKVEEQLISKKIPLKIAIMGCVVNGPGEAREADIGIAGADGKGILFKKGKVVKKVPEEKLIEVLLEEIEKYESANDS